MDADLRAAILTYTRAPSYKPVKPKLIAERLGLLEDEQLAAVKRVIKRMVKDGELEYGPNHLIMPTGDVERTDLPPGKKKKQKKTSNEISDKNSSHKDSKKSKNKKSNEAPDGRKVIGQQDSDGDIDNVGNNQADENSQRSKSKSGKTKHGTDKKNHIVGTFRRVGSGDGFVRPENTPASAGRDADIHVAQKASLDAASGDTVRIKIDAKSGYKGKPEGRVLDVVERATSRFVGVYLEDSGMGLVDVDGKVFTKPIYVGDPGAKGVKSDDKVVIDMVRFPSHVRDGEGVIVQVLGGKGDPGVDTMSIIYEFNLPGEFREDILASAREQADKFDESIGPDRRDLTGETVITIDPATARDFDDAISLKQIDSKHGDKHWLLGVHIADVSHFVPEKTPLDNEAYDRATSVYLPDQVIPMLPEIISNNLASLQPDKVRYAMTAEIEMTAEGVPVACEVFKSAIKSCRRFTYEEVDEFLADRESWKSKLEPEVHTLLGNMHTLAMTLRQRRFDAGSLELSMPEVRIDIGDDGKMSGAHVEENTESHQMIEEFMLAANIAVATMLEDAGLVFLRRVHPDPDPRKLKTLTSFVRELGFKVESLESRFELQKLLEKAKGDPRQHAVNYAVLRSMQRAVYSPEDEGHYALAADTYCHFTSPIRRYPDLTIHRLINQLNSGKKPIQKVDEYFQWGDHCSEREGRATAAERELTKMKLLNYLKDKVGLEMEGIITGVERFGLFVVGREIPAEGLIHISALGDDYYNYDRDSHSITGYQAGNAFRLGDLVRVAVARVDVDARELDFKMLGKEGSGKKSQSGGPKGKRTKGEAAGGSRGKSKGGSKTKDKRKGGKKRKRR